VADALLSMIAGLAMLCPLSIKGCPALPRKPSFSGYLRDARIRRRLSVAEVAEQIGVTTASIYFWETDHCRPRDENLSALCKVLKLPIRATREMSAAG
jgi:DNA-binding XRE family transcriptional regulator